MNISLIFSVRMSWSMIVIYQCDLRWSIYISLHNRINLEQMVWKSTPNVCCGVPTLALISEGRALKLRIWSNLQYLAPRELYLAPITVKFGAEELNTRSLSCRIPNFTPISEEGADGSPQIFHIRSNLWFLAQQGRLDAPIKMKCGREEHSTGQVQFAWQFFLNRWRCMDMGISKI